MNCVPESTDVHDAAQTAPVPLLFRPAAKNTALTLKVVSTFKEFQALKTDWNGLLEQTGVDRVYMTHEWFTAWWRAFGDGKCLFIVLVTNGDHIYGIVPLMRFTGRFRGMPVRAIGFMENEDSPGCSFIVKRGYEQVVEDVISFIMNDVGHWDVLLLKNMPGDETDRIAEFLNRNVARRIRHMTTGGLKSPYLNINGDWETFFGGISVTRKKTLRNIGNRLKKLGDITIKEHGSAEKLNEMAVVSEKAWKHKEGIAFISQKERRRFFQYLSEIAQHNGWLSIWFMYKTNEPIAYEYHLKYKRSDTALLSDFDADYSNVSPGANLDYEVVKTLFGRGITEYDMCGAPDDYKKKWTDDMKNYKNLVVFNDSLYARLLYVFERRIVDSIKRILRRRNSAP